MKLGPSHFGDGGPHFSTPDKPIIQNVMLSKEEIAEIKWRFESLKPYLKPGSFDG